MLLWIAIGGAAGALARYGLSGWVHTRLGESFPWGTLVVNACGCLALGFFLRYVEGTTVSPEARGMVAIGVLGAFTTFSTFSWEAVMLIRDGAWARATAYISTSVLIGLGALFAGVAAAAALRLRG